ncbi:MAG: hypothetical protein SD837_17865 [Candidatus Electrothrix scaldis]|nr:MAG: hypothetical protein SD837_17865 [Candidatus Electrothrix sp. GW3-3]
MQHFELESWHIMVFFFTIILAIIKNDITNAVHSFFIIKSQKHFKGKEVQILSPAGTWDNITIVDYTYDIPFIEGGGVIIQQKDQNGKIFKEKISFTNWKAQRMRTQK